jgi:hypothetical protein
VETKELADAGATKGRDFEVSKMGGGGRQKDQNFGDGGGGKTDDAGDRKD